MRLLNALLKTFPAPPSACYSLPTLQSALLPEAPRLLLIPPTIYPPDIQHKYILKKTSKNTNSTFKCYVMLCYAIMCNYLKCMKIESSNVYSFLFCNCLSCKSLIILLQLLLHGSIRPHSQNDKKHVLQIEKKFDVFQSSESLL